MFETANAGFAQAVYEEYLRDPAAVSEEWRRLFESGVVGETPSVGTAAGNGKPTAASPALDAPVSPATPAAEPVPPNAV
ncbi:MAG TPA: hypothetical protein PKA66_03290, partial [Gemmatimonadales bacterium]|nr:hypothetical protein [Gemmatimonadales bacterium]